MWVAIFVFGGMYFGDHPPPHFHAEYGEHRAVIDIRTLESGDHLSRAEFERRYAQHPEIKTGDLPIASTHFSARPPPPPTLTSSPRSASGPRGEASAPVSPCGAAPPLR